MAQKRWTTPETWATGDNVTASLLNVNMADDIRFLRNQNTASAICTGMLMSGTVGVTAMQAHYMRVVFGSGVIQSLRIRVDTQGGIIALGVYDSTGTGKDAVPNSRVAWTGPVDCPGVGEAVLPLNAAVDVGEDHWFALVCSDATPAFAATNGVSGITGYAHYGGVLYYQTAVFPLPETASVTGAGGDKSWMIAGVQ